MLRVAPASRRSDATLHRRDGVRIVRGLINGIEELSAGAIVVRAAEVRQPQGSSRTVVVLEGSVAARVGWRTEVEGLDPDVTSDETSATHPDYRGLAWDKRSAVIIAGTGRAVVLDQASGEILQNIDLPVLPKASLDLLLLGLLNDGAQLVVCAGKRLLVIGLDGKPRLDYRPQGFFKTVELRTDADGAGHVYSVEYDVSDPKLPLVSKQHRS